MDKYAKRELARVNRARMTKDVCVTCPASRHAAMIGEALAKGRKYHMIDEEPEHVAVTLLSTVGSLWQARAELMRLKAKYGIPRNNRTGW
jgi:hypothetical protein